MLFENEGITVLLNECMKNHSTFKIGGEADFYVIPKNTDELKKAVKICTDNNIPYFILGNGSNILVSDNGIEGAVISTEALNAIEKINENTIYAQSGALLSRVASFAASNSLSGFEPLGGIPGTIGGAVFMNAGAYGGEIKDVISKVYAFDRHGNEVILSAKECNFGYRTSIFTENSYVITAAEFTLKKGDKENILSEMHEFNRRRCEKQPLSLPSAGSTFKRPDGYFAGKLIEDSGLRGYSIGGATVSEKHCGFVVNSGGATCADVVNLIAYIKKCVHEKFGVDLCEEVRITGRK